MMPCLISGSGVLFRGTREATNGVRITGLAWSAPRTDHPYARTSNDLSTKKILCPEQANSFLTKHISP